MDRFRLGGSRKGFSSIEFFGFFFDNTSSCYLMFASLFLYSLYFTFIVYCLCSCTRVVPIYCASFTLIPHLDKYSKSNQAVFLKLGGLNKD